MEREIEIMNQILVLVSFLRRLHDTYMIVYTYMYDRDLGLGRGGLVYNTRVWG